MREGFQSVSLGQGQGPKAERMIEEGSTNGQVRKKEGEMKKSFDDTRLVPVIFIVCVYVYVYVYIYVFLPFTKYIY